jgi:hypothetical protein
MPLVRILTRFAIWVLSRKWELDRMPLFPRLYQLRANLQTIFCCVVWSSLHLPTHELNNRAAVVLIIMVVNQINEAKVEVSTYGFFKWTPICPFLKIIIDGNHFFILWDNWECNKMSCWLIVACRWLLLSRIQMRRPFFNWNCSTDNN